MLLKYCAIVVLIVIWTVPHIDSKGGRGGSGGGSRGGSFSWGSSRMSSSVATSRPYTSNSYGSRTYYSNNYRSSYQNTRRTFASETATQSSSRASKSSNSRSDGWYLSDRNYFNKRTSASNTYTQPPNPASESDYTSDDFLLDRRIYELSNPDSFLKKMDTYLKERLESSKRPSTSPNSGLYDSVRFSDNKMTFGFKTVTESSTRVSEPRSASVLKSTPRNYVQYKPETSTSRSTGYHIHRNRSYKEGNNTNYNETYEIPRVHNTYYSEGGSTKSAVLAGLGGSALGLFLGHQLSNINKNYNSYYPNGSQTFHPKYSVVHHYNRGASPITRDAKIDTDVIIECANITFCTPNTQPLCLVNGTIYCLAPIDTVTKCNENSTSLVCVNTTLTTPCLNSTDIHCDNTSHLKNETIQIPCITNLYVFGKLKMHQVKNISTMDTNSTEKNNSTVDTKSFVNSTSLLDTNTTASVAITAQSPPRPENPRISYKGTVNEFCVTVIAQPVFEPKNLTNAEFVRYVSENEQVREQVRVKFEKILEMLLT